MHHWRGGTPSALTCDCSPYDRRLAIIPALACALLCLARAPAAATAEWCSAQGSAIVEVNQAFAGGPRPAIGQAALLLRRGQLFHERGYYREALADYDAVLELAPDFATAYVDRGCLYADRADYPAALAEFDRAIELQPSLVEAYLQRGNA